MPSPVNSYLPPAFLRWFHSVCDRSVYVWLRVAFCATWLTYDVLDLALGGTRGFFWAAPPSLHSELVAVQICLIFCEGLALAGLFPSIFLLAAFGVRLYETTFFPLNDFYYFCTVALILSWADSEFKGARAVRAWPRDVLVCQTAWIYFSTALLKMNPPFLSGGDLFVRQNYMARALGWPYPAIYRTWISGLFGNSVLAYLAVIFEFSLSFLLLAWLFLPKRRRLLRRPIAALALGIHAFGLLALNVLFFSVSIVGQILTLVFFDRKPLPSPEPPTNG